MRKILTTFLTTIFSLGIFGIFLATPVQAASSLYILPSSKTIEVGDTLSVTVRFNSGSTQLRGAQTYISYPVAKLKFDSIDPTGSAFPLTFANEEAGGVVKIARTSMSAVSGDKLIATIKFTAKATGSAALGFTADTYLTKFSDSSNEPASKTGAIYTITKASSSTGNTTGVNVTVTTGTTGTTSTKVVKKDTKAPIISDVKVTNVGFEAATINWKTNEKSTSVVEYGPSAKLGLVSFNNSLTTAHKISLSKFLSSGMKIYYKVTSKDAAGNTAASKLTSFKTKGYSLKLRIVNLDGEPLIETKITLVPGFETVVTDSSGFALFTDMSAGRYSVNVETGDQVLASNIQVAETKNPETVQEFEIKVAVAAATQGKDLVGAGSLVIISILVAIAMAVVWLFRNHLFAGRVGGAGIVSGTSEPSAPTISSSLPKSPVLPQPQVPAETATPIQRQEAVAPKASTQIVASKPLMPRNEPKLDAVKWKKNSK